MSRCAVKFTLLLLLFSTITRAQGLDTGAWPTQDHDNRRSNQGTFSGPTSPGTPQLIYDAGSPIVSELVITSDGKLVLGGCSQQVIANQIVAIDATGKPVWPAPYTLIASNNESPMGFTVDASGRIYASAHDCPDIPGGVPVHLYSILPTGTSTPNWPIGFPAMYEPAAIGADGTIYQMDELTTLRALRPSDGSVVWSQNFCCFGQGAIALDSAGNLYASADGDEFGSSGLWSWSSAGALRWTALNGIGGAEFDRLFNTTAISPADVIYVSSLSGTVYAFNTSGSLLPGWPFVTGSPTASDSQRDSLAVGGSGTVYIKTVSAVFAINPDGSKKWSYSPGGDGTLSPLAVLDSNENVYFAFGDIVYSLTSSGTLRWTVPLDSPGRLYIGGAGTLYVISANQRVYVIKDAGSSPATCELNVTKVYQAVDASGTPQPWACDVYNHPYGSESSRYCLPTPAQFRIAQVGCALTALTMSLDTAGLSFDPGSLNSFMLQPQHAYDFGPDHGVSFDTTVDDVASSSGKILDWNFFTSNSAQDLRTALCRTGAPIVVGVDLSTNEANQLVPGHYVLVTGWDGSQFQIADPGYPNRTSLLAYGNEFIGAGYVTDPQSQHSSLHVSTADAELLATDPNGLKSGFDIATDEDVNQIPASGYSRSRLVNDENGELNPQTGYYLDVHEPADGTYTIAVQGLKLEPYSLAVRVFDDSGNAEPPLAIVGIGAPGSSQTVKIQCLTSPGSVPTITVAATFQSTLADIQDSLMLGLIDTAGIANSLTQKIGAAQGATGQAFKNILNAFKNEVAAQSGKHIKGIATEVLMQDADFLLRGRL